VNKEFGFQMTARLDSNQANGQAGSFTDVPNVAAVLCDFPFNNFRFAAPGKVCPASSQVQFMEHLAPRSSPFTFTWTPPATDVGPVHFYVAGNAVNFDGQATEADHVYTASYTLTPAAAITCVTAAPVISRVITASAFGGFPNFGAGSWLEIYGSNFTTEDSRIWGGADFTGLNAPISLDKVSVSINNKPAFVYFMNPGQINVNAPADTFTGNATITVTNCSQTSGPFMLQENPLSPGMLAPDSFVVGGKRYLVAQFADGTYVLNTGAIAGVASRPAKPGEVITVYGIGFGDTTPANPPGVIVSALNRITSSLSITFDGTAASTSCSGCGEYAGLAPNYVGLYQFNITVPNVADGDHAIKVTVNGTPLQQSFFLTTHK
jgi:uncharacterized protein (TIGR03437 family)